MIYTSRHRLFALMMVAPPGLFGFLPGTPAIAQGSSPPIPLVFRPLRGVTVGDTSYVLGDSEPIVGPSIHSDPVFSPDGASLMAIQAHRRADSVLRDENRNDSDDNDFSLVYWNYVTHRSRVVWTYTVKIGESVGVDGGTWFSDSRHYCFSLTHSANPNGGYNPVLSESEFAQSRRELVFVDAVHGGFRPVALQADYLSPVSLSPFHNLLAIGMTSAAGHQNTTNLCIMDASGDVVRTVPFASGEYMTPIAGANWVSDDALNILSTSTVRTADGLQTAVRQDQLNLRTGKIIDQNSPDAVPRSAPPATIPDSPEKLRLLTITVPSSQSDPATTSVYVAPAIPGEAERALVSADAYGVRLVGYLHGVASGIVYFSHGSLLYAPLLKMTATEFKSEQKDRLRIETIVRLQRISRALYMYAAENYGSPIGTSDLRQFLVGKEQPLQNDTDFRDPETGKIAFVYKFNGGLDPGLTYDQEAPIGYMSVENGRFLLTNRRVTFESARDNAASAKSTPR